MQVYRYNHKQSTLNFVFQAQRYWTNKELLRNNMDEYFLKEGKLKAT